MKHGKAKMTYTVRIDPAGKIIKRLGLDKTGDI